MSSIFTRILAREIPGHILWEDSKCFAFLDIRPINRGHTLVVPIQEIDMWTDLPEETASHCMKVARKIGKAQMEAYKPKRVGLMIAGFEVSHVHLHVIPINDMSHLDFANANPSISDDELISDLDRLKTILHKKNNDN
jgi:histidine triad (HIT) family protein